MPENLNPISREVEYDKTIAYIHYMYDTRHQIVQFVVGINTALFAVVFQFLKTDIAKTILSFLGCIVTLAFTLMAKRALRYLTEVELYAQELEEQLGFGLIQKTSARMPKGVDSSLYLLVVYWILVVTWALLSIYYALRLFGMALPQL